MPPHFHGAGRVAGQFQRAAERDRKSTAQAFGSDFLIIRGQHGGVEPGQRLHDERRVLD
jgi:hypothetical protein